MSKFGNKNPLFKNALFGYFWARILKNYCQVCNQHFRICLIAKFCEETKMQNLGPKMPYLVVFGLEFQKKLLSYWNPHPQICLFAKFHEKTKMPKFWTKNAWFGYFWTEIWKQYSHIWNQHPQICLIAKFLGKTKTPKFWTKMALFGYFWTKMFYFGIFGQEFQKKLLSYLKSAASNLSNWKILRKNQNP